MNKTNNVSSLVLAATASIGLTLGLASCNNNQNPAPDNTAQSQPAQPDQTQSQDPAAAANLAPASEAQTSVNQRQIRTAIMMPTIRTPAMDSRHL